ncbi:MAG: metalloprotease PmbA [Gammaproteobacteria bacterium]|jgi:PmbA protein|nr:metalloprotease PmbA [Gammaproteobacteria bacterium]MBT4462868.1 metalloprotease PmbA [Gammaproteobacteria bacterium]MBT5116723.1 metalloprotease PmbA [Gammaproteobacteria bacterium]MBT5761821.1 metalloprotease PmbA [Gammaproteobacteria bacterium]MBT6331812.1 metalloprotease PmbA [Gammaproteobacteria bacterium]
MNSNENNMHMYKDRIQDIYKELNKKYSHEFNLSISNGYTVTSRSSQVENIEYHEDMALNVSVYNDYKKGSASTNNLSLENILKTIKKAENISQNTQADNCQGLPESDFTEKDWDDLGIYYPTELKVEEVIEMTKDCEAEAFRTDKRISNSEGSSFSFSKNAHMILNTNGAYGTYRSTDYSLSCIALAEENKLMERDYWYSSSRDFNRLEKGASIGKKAADRVLSRLGAKTIKTRVCPVLFSPEMSASIVSNFLSAINGSAIYKKSSFLLDKINEKIFPDFVNIQEEPLLINGPATRPYDSEGVLTKSKDIISDGVLENYLLDTYASRKLKMDCTGNGVLTNVTMNSSKPLVSNMLSTLHDGVYITDMMGSGANTLTGDYSRGAFGYLVKNGEIQHPVTEITVASNLSQMFHNILALGDDIDLRNRIRTGSLLIDNITIGGTN